MTKCYTLEDAIVQRRDALKNIANALMPELGVPDFANVSTVKISQ